MSKDMDFVIQKITNTNTGKKLLDNATKTRLDALKTASKKVVHKTTEATREFLGNKIADKTVKANPMTDVCSKDAEEIIIPP